MRDAAPVMPDHPARATALLALWNDVAPELEAAYNDWHAREHVPERLTVPGLLWARRYGRADGPNCLTRQFTRYLTLYGLRDAAVLDSAPYQRLLREPTPLSRQMRPALQNISRWVCTVSGAGELPDSAELAVWTFGEGAGRAAAHAQRDVLLATPAICGHLLAERLASAQPLPWLQAEQGQTIEGRWLLCAAVGAVGAIDAAARPALAQMTPAACMYQSLRMA